MQKKFQDFQDFHRRSKGIIFLFCLDLFFLILTFLSTMFSYMPSFPVTSFLIIVDIISLIYTAIFTTRSCIMVGGIEDYFLNSSYGSSISRVHQFHKLMEENLFEYHFQPIIDARTGAIFAYEALMRTDPNSIDMLPSEILDMAKRENRLYEIEKYTFYNTVKIMADYSEVFQNKKLFINSISSHQLTEEDFTLLFEKYSSMFKNIVMEITEATPLDDANTKLINNRLQYSSCQLALDDYGTGYSNESNLLNSNPNYVKIDRTILHRINVDSKRQHLVSNLVNFAKHNNIKVIAEGVETHEELEFVIGLDVDYIQGFYTAKPDPVLINSLSEDLVQQILEINNSKRNGPSAKKFYETKHETILFPVALALEMYTDININENDICFQGLQEMVANLSLWIPDNHKCTITLEQVNLQGSEKPTINIGSNCSVVLNLVGENLITSGGIRVPASSSLTIIGNGNLTIRNNRADEIGIGGTANQTYGDITFASTGNINIFSIGNTCIGVGGGQNSSDAQIRVLSGNVQVESSGFNTVNIGNVHGNALIYILGGKLKLKAQGTKAVAIGSISGLIDIKTSGDLDINCSGKNAVAIGSVEDSIGAITVDGGHINIRYDTHYGSGIGSLSGQENIYILDGTIMIHGQGTDLVGIGDHNGTGNIKITNGILSMQLYAANARPIGNIQSNIIIDGGNIQCDFPEEITPRNSYGTPLVARIITDTDEFKQTVDTINYSYEYKAKYCDRFPYIKVYLPDDILY